MIWINEKGQVSTVYSELSGHISIAERILKEYSSDEIITNPTPKGASSEKV